MENSTQLRDTITRKFDANEIVLLCADLNVDYDSLEGDTKEIKVQGLINYLNRRDRLPELLELCRQLRPNFDSGIKPIAKVNVQATKWLERPVWQGVGAIAGVLGVAAAVVLGIQSLRFPTQTQSQQLPLSTVSGTDAECNQSWFFSPSPSGCLYNFRSTPAVFQLFLSGRALWLQDRGETFIFLDNGEWINIGGDIQRVLKENPNIGQALGNIVGNPRSFITCAGNSNFSGIVSAYISDADHKVLSWTIIANEQKHTGWSYIDNVSSVNCK